MVSIPALKYGGPIYKSWPGDLHSSLDFLRIVQGW